MPPIALVSVDEPTAPPLFRRERGPLRDCLIRGRGHQLEVVPRPAHHVAELRLGRLALATRFVRSSPSGGGGWRATLTLRFGSARPLVAFLGRWCRPRSGIVLGQLPAGLAAWTVGLTRDVTALPTAG